MGELKRPVLADVAVNAIATSTMPAMINLVATRQKSGTPAELLRWYNDHVNLLLRFDGLAGATLYRRRPAKQPSASAEPDYICLYRFASLAAFIEFEASDAKEQARQVTQSGWGNGGIEIIQRSQYAASGKWRGSAHAAGAPCVHIQCLDIAGAQPGTQRWMADRLYLAATSISDVRHYEWYTRTDATSGQQQSIVLAALSEGPTRSALPWLSWWQDATRQSQPGSFASLGQAPDTVDLRWQAGFERACEWQR